MNTIRLTITPEIRQVLNAIKSKYPPLNEPEILKIALSELYVKSTQTTTPAININNLNNRGRSFFAKWLKKQGKNIVDINEDEAYELIHDA